MIRQLVFAGLALSMVGLAMSCAVQDPPTSKIVSQEVTTGAATTDKSAATDKADEEVDEQEIARNLAKLNPEDRKAAEAQKYCAIEEENRLGGMGVPYKVMVKGKPVFLCCKGCSHAALKDADRTLAKVEELKKKAQKEAKKS